MRFSKPYPSAAAIFVDELDARHFQGTRLYLAGQILETEQVFAVLIVLAILGVAVTKAQDLIDGWLSQWRLS